MADAGTALIGFILLVGLMGLGLHVAFVMFFLSLMGAVVYLGWPLALDFARSPACPSCVACCFGLECKSMLVQRPRYLH